MNMKNIRLHRDDRNKENSFYWNIATGQKVDEALIPFGTFVPELLYEK